MIKSRYFVRAILQVCIHRDNHVTLGFGEIVRLTLQNWTSVTGGPRGIDNIPRPGLFGLQMDISASTTYVYYLVLAAVIVTIVVISRLKNVKSVHSVRRS